MEIIEFKQYLPNLNKYLLDKKDIVIVTADELYILNGQNDYDKDFCNNNNLTVLNTHPIGGTIINFAGDICIGNYQSQHNKFGHDFLETLQDFLSKKGIQSTISENDLLIDGVYKIASYMSNYTKEKCLYTAIHISINMDLELIKNICKKTMSKIPKGLSEYGITSDEMLNFLKEVL